MKKLLFLTALALSLSACSEDEGSTYPPMVTEMALFYSDASGNIGSFTTDAGQRYTLVSPFTKVAANAIWRFMVGYVAEADGRATVYSLEGVELLRDSTRLTSIAKDPAGFISAWKGGGFVNLHLRPMTKGGQQAWGYVRDSLRTNPLGGTTHYLSLHHRQGADYLAYSIDKYLSISLDSIAKESGPADTLQLTITTFDGTIQKSFGLSH